MRIEAGQNAVLRTTHMGPWSTITLSANVSLKALDKTGVTSCHLTFTAPGDYAAATVPDNITEGSAGLIFTHSTGEEPETVVLSCEAGSAVEATVNQYFQL